MPNLACFLFSLHQAILFFNPFLNQQEALTVETGSLSSHLFRISSTNRDYSRNSGCTIYDVVEKKSRFSAREKRDVNSLAFFLFYIRKQVSFPVEYKSMKTILRREITCLFLMI